MSSKTLITEDDIIFSYSRQQAIDDGVLVDLSPPAREVGIRVPVAMTRAAWDAAIVPASDCRDDSAEGRAWDVLIAMRYAALQAIDSERVSFTVTLRKNARLWRDIQLQSLVHRGDGGEPVITMMLPHED